MAGFTFRPILFGSHPNAVDPNAYDPNAYDQNQNIQQSMMPKAAESNVIVIDSRGVHDATNDPRAALAAAARRTGFCCCFCACA